MELKKHLLRTAHQDGARASVLQNMENDQGLLVMDWWMKFLPSIYRETLSDFLRKGGISWRFSCLVIRSPLDQKQLKSLLMSIYWRMELKAGLLLPMFLYIFFKH